MTTAQCTVSVVILTLNEEPNIVACIRTLRSWCDDIVVFDSFSTDQTVALAKAEGARIYQRHFDNYAAQRNAALKEIDYPGDWVVMVDADERWDAEIGKKIKTIIIDPANAGVSIFHFQRKDMFMGRWLRHNIGKNTWFGRVLRRQDVYITRDINEEYHCNGEKVYVKGERFLHYPFNNGINWWLHRHNRYSDMEAKRLLAEQEAPLAWADLVCRDPIRRRKALKQLAYRIPGRPYWLFFGIYIIGLGFLDGAAGYHYCQLRCMYERMIDLKILELKRRKCGEEV